VALLTHAHGVVLHVHAVDGQGLGDRAERRGEEGGPGREKVSEGGAGFEVCGEGECCQGS
jgi:hypothetical protein